MNASNCSSLADKSKKADLSSKPLLEQFLYRLFRLFDKRNIVLIRVHVTSLIEIHGNAP